MDFAKLTAIAASSKDVIAAKDQQVQAEQRNDFLIQLNQSVESWYLANVGSKPAFERLHSKYAKVDGHLGPDEIKTLLQDSEPSLPPSELDTRALQTVLRYSYEDKHPGLFPMGIPMSGLVSMFMDGHIKNWRDVVQLLAPADESDEISENIPRECNRIVLCGPPKSNARKVAARLAKRYGFIHVDKDKLIKHEIEAGGKNSARAQVLRDCATKGILPDEMIMSAMIADRVSQPDAVKAGWVLSGYPETGGQSKDLCSLAISRPLIIVSIFVADVADGGAVESATLKGRLSQPDNKAKTLKFHIGAKKLR